MIGSIKHKHSGYILKLNGAGLMVHNSQPLKPLLHCINNAYNLKSHINSLFF